MNTIFSCAITTIEADECLKWLTWIRNESNKPPRLENFRWLLAHCDDGVTWGWFDSPGWQLGSQVFSDLCPEISEKNLLELRLFGPDAEVLIWKNDDVLSGRLLADDAPLERKDPANPMDQDLVLLGDRTVSTTTQNGFTHIGDERGAEQVVPIECIAIFERRRWPLRLKVRHYFEKDNNSGTVRVAATRLVDLYKVEG
jgi:CRISPR-associated protein (TIGR03984 family)